MVTVIDPDPPAAEVEAAYGPSAALHPMPAWFTRSVCPPMRAVKTLDKRLPFGGTVIVTVPLPAPPAGATLRPEAVQAHAELEAVTPMIAVPPPAVALKLAGMMENEHPVPNWVIV
jgi:hypothetical protein